MSRIRPLTQRGAAAAALVLVGGFLAIVIGFAAVVWFSRVATPAALAALDDALLLRAHAMSTPWLDMAAVEVTFLGARLVGGVVLLAAAALLWLMRRRDAVLFLTLVFLGSALMTRVLKALAGRERPDLFEWRVEYAFDTSFPSGHTVNATVFYGALAWLIARSGAAPRPLVAAAIACAVLIAALVGVSRVYLGVHHPSDVLGGWTAGALWLSVCVVAMRAAGMHERRGA
jgi:membrane-associated phospholipid phosphatase